MTQQRTISFSRRRGVLRILFAVLVGVYARVLPVYAETPLLTWTDASHSAIRLDVPEREESVSECIGSGFEVKFRFELELCRTRSYWFDACQPVVVSQKILRFDPVDERYVLSFDIFGDRQKPQITQFTSKEEAVSQVSGIARFRLSSLSKENFENSARNKINLRVTSECKSNLTDSMSKMSQILSLGVIELHRYNSGWISFPLEESVEQPHAK